MTEAMMSNQLAIPGKKFKPVQELSLWVDAGVSYSRKE